MDPDKKPVMLLTRLREVIRRKHYSIRTEEVGRGATFDSSMA